MSPLTRPLDSRTRRKPTSEYKTRKRLKTLSTSFPRLIFIVLLALLPCLGTAREQCATDDLRLHVPSPAWQDQVIYMLFIDRFEDGNPENNDQGFDEFDPTSGAHFNGGDLEGIIERLDYLRSLGVSAIWVTPPVANQWWSTPYVAAGWHGYWAINFREIDKHFGNLGDYRRLSHELHCRGMYLIQDIVANHTANFYTYDGGYDPADTAKNFRLLEPDSHQSAPTQAPFHMIDRLNPEHAAANIYHWTPTIADYADRYQETNHMLGQLADLNTENPVVIAELKDTYKYWISEAGVDAFRVDTAMLVEHEFWNRFLHDSDGIYAQAQHLGKDSFLTFGESVSISEPFKDDGERKLKGYMGSPEQPYLNSMLNYPLYFEIRRVIGRGAPTRQLAHRLNLFMQSYEDPYSIPNFIDNHDTPRFLATGNIGAFEQALVLLFTLPGIPILYQGTEQALTETRQAMFAGGYNNERGSFDANSQAYKLIQSLSEIRRAHRVLRRGELRMIASDAAGAGILAFQRSLGGEAITLVMNTADHSVLAHRLNPGIASGQRLEALFSLNGNRALEAGEDGRVTTVLPARSVFVSRVHEPSVGSEGTATEPRGITITAPPSGGTFSESFKLSGRSTRPGELQLIKNGNMDTRRLFQSDEEGHWSIEIPVFDFGTSENYLQVYQPDEDMLSEAVFYASDVRVPLLETEVKDFEADDVGFSGRYIRLQQPESRNQKDIRRVQVKAGGRNLELTLTMSEVSTNWLPPNGFDNVAFSIFFDSDAQAGMKVLPKLSARMPADLKWDLAHVASGWASYMYRNNGASEHEQGAKLGISPRITTDKEAGTVTFLYQGEQLGIEDWQDTAIYITTWEHNAEGEYTEVFEAPSDWFFGGAPPGSPKILDDALVVLSGG